MFQQTVRSPKPRVRGGAFGYGTLRAVERRLRLPVGNTHGSATWAHFLAGDDPQSGGSCSGQDVPHVEELLAGAGSADGQHRVTGSTPTKETGGRGSLKGMSLASQSVARPSPVSALLQLERQANGISAEDALFDAALLGKQSWLICLRQP